MIGPASVGILSESECAFIDRHRVAHLATADAQGAPHIVPIVYARLGDAVFFVIDDKPKQTRTNLKRLLNISENPRIAFMVDDYDENWTRLAYLLIQGEAHTVTSMTEFAQALSALLARYPQYESMRLEFDTHPMIRITPQRGYLWRAVQAD